jgi:hypothetical protein
VSTIANILVTSRRWLALVIPSYHVGVDDRHRL